MSRRRSIDVVFPSDERWLIEKGIIPAINAISAPQGGAKPSVRVLSGKHLRITWPTTATAETVESIREDERWTYFVIPLITKNGGVMS